MKSSVNVGFIVWMVLLGACNPVRVFLEKEELTAVKEYKTFMVENEFPGKNAYGSPELEKSLQNFLIEGMEERGFVLDINSPDLVLSYNTILSQNQKEVNTTPNYPFGWGRYNPFMWRYPYPYSGGGYKIEKYNLGEVVIDFIDPLKEEAILRISAVGEVNKPEQMAKNIRISAERILTEFSKKIGS